MPKQNIMGQIISQSASAQILNVPPSSLPSAWALLDYILWFTFQGWQWRLSHGGVSEIFHSHHTSQTDLLSSSLIIVCVHPSAQTGVTIQSGTLPGNNIIKLGHHAMLSAYWEKKMSLQPRICACAIQTPTKCGNQEQLATMARACNDEVRSPLDLNLCIPGPRNVSVHKSKSCLGTLGIGDNCI